MVTLQNKAIIHFISYDTVLLVVVDGCGKAQNSTELAAEEYTLMSIDTIINGKEGVFPGLIPILNSYLENMEVDVDTRCSILNYLKLIKKRASGMISVFLNLVM